MSEPEVETLADVLRDLAELAPDRFMIDREGLSVCTDGRTAWWYVYNATSRTDAAMTQFACQQECEEREFAWDLQYNGISYMVGIWYTPDNDVVTNAKCAALAVATALRDALKQGVTA